MATLIELKRAAKDMANVMGLVKTHYPEGDKPDVPFNFDLMDEQELTRYMVDDGTFDDKGKFKGAVGAIEVGDKFNDATMDVIDEMRELVQASVKIGKEKQEAIEKVVTTPIFVEPQEKKLVHGGLLKERKFKTPKFPEGEIKEAADEVIEVVKVKTKALKSSPKTIRPTKKSKKAAKKSASKAKRIHKGILTRYSVFTEIYNENIPRTFQEYNVEMLSRYKSRSTNPVSAKIFTDTYVTLLLYLGFIEYNADDKLVKTKKAE